MPVTPYKPISAVKSKPMTSQNESPRCAVLVVEDEWLVLMDLVDALEGAGFDVTQAGAGEDALVALENDGSIEILVTDIRLAGDMTGWDLAEAYRARRPDGGVVYASANAPLRERQVEGSTFYSKPAPMSELVESCRQLCACPPVARG